MEFNRFCNNIRDNIFQLQKAIGATATSNRSRNNAVCFDAAQSPIIRSNTTPATPDQKRTKQSDNMSIEDDINLFSSPYAKYPCFKCHGVHNTGDMNGSSPLCQECDGSEMISESHPMAALLAKVLKAKIAPILQRKQQQQNQMRRNELKAECKNCKKMLQSQELYYCDTCVDYTLCVGCQQNNRALHVPGHSFIRKNARSYIIKLKQNIPTMKKISEQFQSEQAGVIDEELHCSVCHNGIEQCYEMCQDCGSTDNIFILCNDCSQTHDISHKTMMKTVSKGSMIEMIKPPSSDLFGMAESMEYQMDLSQPYKQEENQEKNEKRANVSQSIVFIPQIEMDESCQLLTEQSKPNAANPVPPSICMEKYQTDSFSFEDGPRFNPETVEPTSPASVKERDLSRLRMDSVINIDMGQEVQQSPMYNESAPTNFRASEMQKYMTKNIPRPSVIVPDTLENEQGYIFKDYQCDICGKNPRNLRYHCQLCQDYDICAECYEFKRNKHPHKQYDVIDGRQILKERARKALATSRLSMGANDCRRSSVRSSVIA